MKNLFLLVFFFLSGCMTYLSGQPLHTSPPFMSDYGKDSVILSVASKSNSIGSIVVGDNTFYIHFKDGSVEIFPLIHKTVHDLCNAVNIKYKDSILLTTNYAFIEATRVETKIFSPVDSISLFSFKFGKLKPSILVDFGVQFSLAQNENQLTNNSLLNQGGFNLDLIGSHRFQLGGDWGLYTSLRLGFASNLNLLLSDSTSNMNAGGSGGQLESAIRQADHVVLGGNTEFTLGFIKSKSIQVGAYLDGGFTYFRLNPIDLSNRYILLRDTVLVPIIGSFSQEAIDRFNKISTKAFPIGYGETGFNFRLIKDHRMIGYGGIGIGVRPSILRHTQYRFLANTDQLDMDYLTHSIEVDKHNWFLRPKIGLRLAQIIELKAEAIVVLGKKGIDRNSNNNMFRIIISSDFPIKKSS